MLFILRSKTGSTTPVSGSQVEQADLHYLPVFKLFWFFAIIELDWKSVLSWTDRFSPVFKTMENTKNWFVCLKTFFFFFKFLFAVCGLCHSVSGGGIFFIYLFGYRENFKFLYIVVTCCTWGFLNSLYSSFSMIFWICFFHFNIDIILKLFWKSNVFIKGLFGSRF